MTSLLLAGSAPAQQQSTIRVGPNVLVSADLVSTDGEGSLFEVMIAANPINPKNLLGAGMFIQRWGSKSKVRGYVSTDGGYSWRTITFPAQDSGGADPLVAFGRTGTAYLVGVAHQPELQTLYVHRSRDGGNTWLKPATLGGADHPQIIVDRTTGSFSGRVYLSYNVSGIKMFRSQDDGRSWIGPIEVAGAGRRGFERITRNPQVFRDGELLVPWVDFPTLDASDSTPLDDRMTFLFATSRDGGSTFSTPQRFHMQGGGEISGTRVPDNFQRLVGYQGSPFFAVDTSGGSFRDRLYMVWADEIYRPRATANAASRVKGTRILFSYSSDRGKSWTTPKVISPGRPEAGNQFGETIAVNHEGTVGISWYDTRDTPRGARAPHVHRYFTASIDGGATFLPAKRVSSAASDLETISANAVSGAMSSGAAFNLRHDGFTEHSGGHYILGLAADTEGTFHAFWPDGRTGSYQLWATRIRVERAAHSVPVTPGPGLVSADVTERIEVALDPLRRPSRTGAIELPVRVRNISDQPMYGPIAVEVTQLDPDGTLLNAENGRSGIGAKYDYTRALGDFDTLAPGATTEAIVWRFKAPVFLSGLDDRASAAPGYKPELPHVSLKVTARVVHPEAK